MLQAVKKAAKWILDVLPGGNYIVFESKPDFSDNTKAVFDEMLRRDLHKKYRMYWWVEDKKADHPRFPNTGYLDQKTLWNRLEFQWITLRAKCLISCNAYLTTRLPSRKAFYLTHGTALKKLLSMSPMEGVQHILIASDHVKEPMARELRAEPDTLTALGYPRNDVFHQPPRDLHALFPGNHKKILVWYPTYRQGKGGRMTGSANALPVLHDGKNAVALNETARQCGVLIVVKPHFAQDISYITQYDLSNILFINDRFFRDHDISSYEFVGSCDGLITDYSSIFFDYLLCDKPVAVIWEDIEDYRQNPGFAMDPEEAMAGSHKIYDLEDFRQFLKSVAAGDDPFRQERKALNARMNYASDGKNTQRVTDFIIEKAKL